MGLDCCLIAKIKGKPKLLHRVSLDRYEFVNMLSFSGREPFMMSDGSYDEHWTSNLEDAINEIEGLIMFLNTSSDDELNNDMRFLAYEPSEYRQTYIERLSIIKAAIEDNMQYEHSKPEDDVWEEIIVLCDNEDDDYLLDYERINLDKYWADQYKLNQTEDNG